MSTNYFDWKVVYLLEDFCRLRSDTNFISLLILFLKDILVTDLFRFFCQWHGSDHPVFQAQAYVKMTDQWIDINQ